MSLKVEYGENIIVAVVYCSTWSWYITEKDIWYLDLPMLENAILMAGRRVFNLGDYSSRFDIPVLNEVTASDFLSNIADLKVDVSKLRRILLSALQDSEDKRETIIEYIPSLLVNFDDKTLFSLFPEPASFEKFVPMGWQGVYDDFLNIVPNQERYWMNENINHFNT